MTYDNWKSTDPNVERAGAEEDALDAYEQQVWDYLAWNMKTQYGHNLRDDLLEDYRDMLADWMNDNTSHVDAAIYIMELEEEK